MSRSDTPHDAPVGLDDIASLYREATTPGGGPGGGPDGRPGRGPGPDCLPFEALERLAQGSATPQETRAGADHLAACSLCGGIVLDLRSVSSLSPTPPRRAVAEMSRAHRRPRVTRSEAGAWALAALLALGLGIAALVRDRAPAGSSSLSSIAVPSTTGEATRGGPTALRPGAVLEPAAGAVSTRLPRRFAWPPQAGATGYRLRLETDAGEFVWSSGWIDRPTAMRPETAPPSPTAPGLYRWTVDVRGPASTASLGPFVFGLEAGPAP